jgi:hypothetical protein
MSWLQTVNFGLSFVFSIKRLKVQFLFFNLLQEFKMEICLSGIIFLNDLTSAFRRPFYGKNH